LNYAVARKCLTSVNYSLNPMIKGTFPVDQFQVFDTPFYYYDMELLRATLDAIKRETENRPFHIHYALKANANPHLLKLIASYGFGADCVSGNEIRTALACGFTPDKILFAGVGKTDKDILIGLEHDISCFNVESLPELEVMNCLAGTVNKKARVALRVNPNVDARTHRYITTGLNENKFGINEQDIPKAINMVIDSPYLELIGLHFHIGSQITDLSSFEDLCVKAREWQKRLNKQGLKLPVINVGGGLGINYHHPNHFPVADFEAYFRLFERHLVPTPGQSLFFELGRSIVASCGSLITRVLYVKEGIQKNFLIVDAGMTDLVRPALYGAYHHIENLTSNEEMEPYDVVGPICESSDVFAEQRLLNRATRGDLIAIRSAGAYGETMTSTYNGRELPASYFSDQL
jgi:diaminopimelate decarboxylase